MTGGLARVTGITCKIAPFDWPFAREEAARIDARWAALRVEKPALYDGRVLLSRDLAVEDGVLRGSCFETGYKSFLCWRDFGFPGAPVFNCFAMPALVSADGAFMLGEMSAGTANAGKLYFPAGTPEPADLGADGCIDYEASILRELEEETGLSRAEVALEPDWTIVSGPRPVVGCMRVARAALDAEALHARLAAFNATQAAPELTRLVAVREVGDLDPARMPDFMLTYLRAMLGA